MTTASPVQPVATVAPAPSTPRRSATAVDIARAPDGLFYVTAQVNDHPVRFLVDTGATVVMLTREDAATIGLDLDQSAFQAEVRTANGSSAMAWTRLNRIAIAGQRLADVEAAVPQGGLPVSLLGQNLLSKLGAVTIDGNRLRVHGKAGDTL